MRCEPLEDETTKENGSSFSPKKSLEEQRHETKLLKGKYFKYLKYDNDLKNILR